MGSGSKIELASDVGAASEPSETSATTVRETPRDLVFVEGTTEHGLSIVRLKSDADGEPQIEVGELRPIREGQPLHGEVLKLTPRSENARLFDAEVLLPAPSALAAGGNATSDAPSNKALPHKGPARVTTEAFRTNWDGIFGGRLPTGAAN